MREHQIVINLKPDQFEEVQRMARAAGSKSVGVFVRQKLISTLNLASPRSGAAEDSDAPDIKQLTGELRRLHRELQIFVADSLSNSDYTNSTVEAVPFPTAVQENFLAEGAPLMPESMGFTYRSESDIEYEAAQPQSPFLTQYPRPQLPSQFPPDSTNAAIPAAPPPQFQTQISQTTTPQSTDFQAPFAIPPANSAPQLNPGIQPAYALPPDPNAAPYAMPNSANMQPAYSVPEAPPDFAPTPAQPTAPVSEPSQSSARNVQGFAENDELEDLAERAFAISPRLGQLDESVKRFPDPLKDLLEDALINGLDDDDEETALIEAEVPEESQALPVSESTIEEGSPDVEELESPEHEIATSEETLEEESVYDESESETQADTDEEGSSDSTPTDPPPPMPPPISGGPPPRKRRT